ncbi:MAG TPA: hypothetical protein VMW72_12050 [Sedimentisphaerales bacterium]|nr:hypothetical protein [Sedimentisphaerales bacterium]
MCRKLTYLYFVLMLGLFLASAANAADLVGWWKFDGDTLDSSGLDNEATLFGGPDFVDGWLNQAVFLDG